ncbi:hypothetical protein [Stenotrophomonas pigmentata]|uniref:hypothetical protein n=1 Tax=Stenotrophomonas pigmentata TaxID=3055080 RepID=UPI0026EC1C91|nr:hypothetical protein [Stenotrophomonas sp. 610A2]
MATTSLPSPFAWQDHFEGQALILRDRAIATLFPLPNGHVRCTRKLHTRHMTHSFHEDSAQAERFIEAWARRWEREILNLYDGLAVSTYQTICTQEPRNDQGVYVPPRKPRRRKR